MGATSEKADNTHKYTKAQPLLLTGGIKEHVGNGVKGFLSSPSHPFLP